MTLSTRYRRLFGSLLFGSLFVFSLSPSASAQTPAPRPKAVYTFVEKMPQLATGGGTAAIVTAIQQRLAYPPQALLAQVEGRVFVSFTVSANGLVEDVAVVKGLVPSCDSAVVKAVQQLPRFTAGRQAGRAVAVQFTVPVTFRVEEAQPSNPGK